MIDDLHDDLETLALRIGLKPLEWEQYQPVELYALADAAKWRREQDQITMANAIGMALGGGENGQG